MNNQPYQKQDYFNPPIKKPTTDSALRSLDTASLAKKSQIGPKPIIIETKDKTPFLKRLRKNFLPLSIITLFGLLVIYGWLGFGSYFNPLTGCRIRIHSDLVAGNKKTIIKSIRLLKKEDRQSYATACKYVDRIYERTCFGSDWHIDKSQQGSQEAGCYVKGTKSIYIKPDFGQSTQLITLRIDAIKKYSRLSQEYWEK